MLVKKRVRTKLVRHKKVDDLGGLAFDRLAARKYKIKPDWARPFVVEVRIARTRNRMRAEYNRLEGMRCGVISEDTQGLVRHYFSRITRKVMVRPGLMIARMYLNSADLRKRPSEIVSHECVHAGMAWARFLRCNVTRNMDKEEVLAHAVGRMTAQVNALAYRIGAFT